MTIEPPMSSRIGVELVTFTTVGGVGTVMVWVTGLAAPKSSPPA